MPNSWRDELGAYMNSRSGGWDTLQSLAFRACRLCGHGPAFETLDPGTGQFASSWQPQPVQKPEESRLGGRSLFASWPGQACGYKIGQSEIIPPARRAPRPSWARLIDFKRFNTAVVLAAIAPLSVVA